MPDPVTPSQKTIVQCSDSTYETIDFDDDMESLNYENVPNPGTSYTKLEFSKNPQLLIP